MEHIGSTGVVTNSADAAGSSKGRGGRFAAGRGQQALDDHSDHAAGDAAADQSGDGLDRVTAAQHLHDRAAGLVVLELDAHEPEHGTNRGDDEADHALSVTASTGDVNPDGQVIGLRPENGTSLEVSLYSVRVGAEQRLLDACDGDLEQALSVRRLLRIVPPVAT